MSSVQLRVELPAHAHSFAIQVPSSATVADVKREIFRVCVGGPRVEGQRIVWRGRYLSNDERVEDLWKSSDDVRIVHLAVNPSAWTSTPPEIPRVTRPPSPAETPHARRPQFDPTPIPPSRGTIPSSRYHPLAFVMAKHQRALSTLTREPLSQITGDDLLPTLRSTAMQVVEAHGWSWPDILDQEFPAHTEGGLKYDILRVNGQQYLSLSNPTEKPTPIQIHALEMLTYTFQILSLDVSQTQGVRRTATHSVPVPLDVNALLQQMGLPPLHVAQRPNPNPNPNGILPELREMPLRPLLAPMMLLLLRTLLLLYLVAPTRKPVIGVLVLIWMLYEIWRPIQIGLMRGWRRQAPAQQEHAANADPQAQNRDDNAQAAPQRAPEPAGGVNRAAAPHERLDHHATALLDTLANMNIETEEGILGDPARAVEPGLGQKLAMFFSLLFTTMHPAVWNRRRTALNRREGRVRTEEGVVRETPEDGEDENRVRARAELEERRGRRPGWVREYISRVVAGEWVDDSD